MDSSGMRGRTLDDVEQIRRAVDGLRGPLQRHVDSIVNDNRFDLRREVEDT